MTNQGAEIVVLVVEDELLLQEQLVEPLRETGFKVLTADRGEQALATLEREGSTIRALITDVNLGGKTSGWDVAHKARELNPQIPVIYTTSYPPDDWAAHGVPNSIHIGKPFVPVQVITAVSQLLNASTQPNSSSE